jgi:hypothetical protein
LKLAWHLILSLDTPIITVSREEKSFILSLKPFANFPVEFVDEEGKSVA